MFKLLLLSCLVIFFCVDFVFLKNVNFICKLRDQVINLKLYQVTVSIENTALTRANIFFNYLTSEVSAVIIDMDRDFHNQSLIVPLVNLRRESNLLVVYQNHLNQSKIQSVLKKFIQLSPMKIRPKCLIFFNESIHDNNAIESVLLHGWSKKFLDFTIINMDNGIIFSYNPFFSVFNHGHIFSTSIFPNKLKDMNKYPVRIAFNPHEPYMFDVKIGNVVEYFGIDVDNYKFFEFTLNFKINFISVENAQSLISLIESSKIDLTTGRASLLFKWPIEPGIVVTYHKICAIIANENSLNLELSMIKFFFLASNIIIVFSVANLLHCILITMKTDSDIFTYIRVLLGQSTKKLPKNVTCRIVVLLLGIFSMIFFPDIVSQLTQIFVENEEKSISSYKDILDANLQPYTLNSENLELRSTDKFLKVMKSKTIYKADERKCVTMAIKEKNVICIISLFTAEMYIKKYKTSGGKPLLKLTNVDFPKAPESYAFSPASPYVEAFDRVTRIMFETGIFEKIKSKYFDSSVIDNFFDKIDDNQGVQVFFTRSLSILCLIGYTISAFVFTLEMTIWFLKKIEIY